MSMTATAKARLDIGKAFQDTINVVTRNIAPFGLMAMLLTGLPSLLQGLGQIMRPHNLGVSTLSTAISLAGLVTVPILQGALIYGTMRDLAGDRASIAECIAAGRKRWLPMLGMSILMGLGIVLGFMLLVVPGVLLLLRWCLSGPVLIMERGRTIGDAMGRSVDLTKGHRGSIFLLFLIYGLVLIVYQAIFFTVIGGPTGIRTGAHPIMLIVAQPLMTVVFQVVLTCSVTVVYQQLRGGDTFASREATAEVFA